MADRRALLVSSANLTAYALTLNMELGLLVRGGDLPGRVAGHFDRLIEAGVLIEAPRVAAGSPGADAPTPSGQLLGRRPRGRQRLVQRRAHNGDEFWRSAGGTRRNQVRSR